MPLPDPRRQRQFALEVVRALRAAGHEAYWAGGCVRDELLGRQPKDYDVASSATPAEIQRVFRRRRTLAIGAAFGVITVLGPRRAGQIEVATFREDDHYSDGRRPDSVRFSTAAMDARRRDFTINGLFYDPDENRVLDYVGGQEDLHRGLVRAIGDPHVRFDEDRLRMLRAIRFTATFQFELEGETQRAVRTMAHGIDKVSAERIGTEVQLMLVHATRAEGVQLMRATGLLRALLPELDALCGGEKGGPQWQATLRVLAALRNPDFALALAALLHSMEEPSLVKRVGARWRLRTRDVARATWLVQNCRQIDEATTMDWSRLQRLLISDGIDQLLALNQAVVGGESPQLVFCRERLALPSAELDPPPLVTGDDLLAHGIAPGKPFGRLLERLRDAQLNRLIHTRAEALALADQLLADAAGDQEGCW